jgi:membrane-bound lytic murein transglycosylase
MTNAVDDLYLRYEELLEHIPTSDVSLQNWAHENFRRVLVLTMANHLENETRTILVEFARKKSGSDLVCSFMKNSMERQYHTYFEWKGNNANKFFAFFGDTFKKEVTKDIASKDDVSEGMRAFLEIGRTRNILMHERLHAVNIGNKTAKEFYDSFKKALVFVDYLRTRFE